MPPSSARGLARSDEERLKPDPLPSQPSSTACAPMYVLSRVANYEVQILVCPVTHMVWFSGRISRVIL